MAAAQGMRTGASDLPWVPAQALHDVLSVQGQLPALLSAEPSGRPRCSASRTCISMVPIAAVLPRELAEGQHMLGSMLQH